MPPDVSIIVIHFGKRALTEHTLACFAAAPPEPATEIIVVDNGTAEAEMYIPTAGIHAVRLHRNAGYAAACNAGAAVSKGTFLYFVNNDIDFDGDIVALLAERARGDKRIGVIGPRLTHADGRFQLSYGEDPTLRSEYLERKRQRESRQGDGPHYRARERQSALPRPVDWVTGAALFTRREAFEGVGGFDAGYFFYFEDADYCRRVRDAGYSVEYDPRASIVHLGGGSDPGSNPAIRRAYRLGQLRYYSRHNSRVSFCLLKLYLLARYAWTLFVNGDAASERRSLWTDIIRAPFRPS